MSLRVLGIHCGHDRSAALVVDGEIVCAVAEERLDRRKHSEGSELPLKAIRYCLDSQGLSLKDIDCFAVTSTRLKEQIFGLDMFRRQRVEFITHHLAHAASAYFSSGETRCGILVCDGTGAIVDHDNREAESIFLGEKGSIRLVNHRTTPGIKGLSASQVRSDPDIYTRDLSLGNYYNEASRLIFHDWRYAGKVMALAGFAAKRAQADTNYLKGYNIKSSHLGGIDRQLSQVSVSLDNPFGFDKATSIAREVQNVLRQRVSKLAALTLKLLGGTSLCYSGGVAYNCPVNSYLLTNGICINLHMFPACGDDGCSVGAALYMYARLDQTFLPQRIGLPFFGREQAGDDIENAVFPFIKKNFLENCLHLGAEDLSDNAIISSICDDVDRGKIVCLFRSKSEFGPRALGNRSILADPRLPGTQILINRMKGREWFRPLGVMILEDEVEQLLKYDFISPYMLLTNEFKNTRISRELPIAHIDGSIRIQTVGPQDSKFHYHLLSQWKKRSGIPVLINTSFNYSGEPIVENPIDAVKSFLRIGAASLYLGRFKFTN